MTLPVRPETFFIRTYGCQMNLHDSDRMAQLLMGAGMVPVDEPQQAGLIIVNSCSVRAKPENKALSETGCYRNARVSRGVRVILAGCVARQEGQRLLSQANYLDAVIGPGAVGRLPEIVDQIVAGRGPVLAIEDHDLQDPRFVALGSSETGSQASVGRFVTIMKGCDNFCTYCIVPHVRGREVSRPMDEILAEVEELGRRRVREVTLLGQNVNSYRDRSGTTFPELLAALDRQAAVDRIRFMTSHPKDLGEELVQALAELPRVVEHLHLALQSGSDGVLERMKRGYTRDSFLKKALRLRERVEGIGLTTDLIVGFPGETEQDFRQTLDVVKQAAFDSAFSFKFSPRPGTLAAGFDDDVPAEAKQERLLRLQTLLIEMENTSLGGLLGDKLEVLVEGASVRNPAAWTGRTRCNRVVNFQVDRETRAGRLVQVEILEVRGHTLWGKMLE